MFGKSSKEERQPENKSRGWVAIEREQRPGTVTALSGSIVGSGGAMGAAALGWASATVGEAAAAGGVGVATIVGGHFLSAGIKRVFRKTDNVESGSSTEASQDTATAAKESGGGSAATVQDVAKSMAAVVGSIQSDVVNSATGIKTRIEVALGRMLAATRESSHQAPERIEQALLSAMREADQVHRTGVSAIDKAEDWAKGL